jgi:hypothetical protein
MKLDLSNRILEVEKPDGGTISILPRRMTRKTADEISNQIDDLNQKRESKEIENMDYMFEVLKVRIQNFEEVESDLGDLDVGELNQILRSLNEVMGYSATEEEKKTT